jgi:hypothetical protein
MLFLLLLIRRPVTTAATDRPVGGLLGWLFPNLFRR